MAKAGGMTRRGEMTRIWCEMGWKPDLLLKTHSDTTEGARRVVLVDNLEAEIRRVQPCGEAVKLR